MKTMHELTTDIEHILESILRGAAKILGCISANLIIFNRKTREVYIRVGASAERANALGDIESVLGGTMQSMVFSIEEVSDSLVAAAWRDRTSYETSSLVELVGTAFPREMVEQVSEYIGVQSFICVPVTCGPRIFGVMIFTKEDQHPYGPQQREILLRYAQRIGEIIDNDLRSRGSFVTHRQTNAGDTVQRQLLHLALGETAPAILVDPDYRITSFNEATTRMFGFSGDELLNQPIGLFFRDEDDVRTIVNHQFLFLSDGYFEDTAVVRHRSGRVFPGKVKALLLADADGRVIGFLVVINDHSSVADANDQAASLNQLMRRERLATMGELAAQLAHEIRNPLISIGATLEMLSRSEDAGPEIAGMLSKLAGEVTRVDLLLRDYLTLASRRSAKVATVDVAELVEDARRLVSGGQSPNGRTITADVDRGLSLLGDYEGLRHVLLNLFRNAIEASPRDGQIVCRASGTERDICIRIEDQGPGLVCSADDCVKPFFTTKANGTGMGLTVCQRIVQTHGGSISLKNREQGGCTVSVVIPRKAVP